MAEQNGIPGTDGNDLLEGTAADDLITGGDGHDRLSGGYGNDELDGGSGNDALMGGRGSDLLLGGDGDDLLISRSDAGEQRIGQLAIGEPTRGDPDGEVDAARQKLYTDQPIIGDDILVGGAGRDTFLFAPQLNAKLGIIEKHLRADGTIKWSAVAHENNELHDHWTDHAGIDIVADFVAGEDHIAVIGHTANVAVEHRDIDGDGDEESLITVYSVQGNGGAHTADLLGQVIVFGDRVEEDDIQTDAGVTYGIVPNFADVQEAINPQGDLKVSIGPNGEQLIGYDTRDDQGNLGEVTANPHLYVDNPFLGEVTYAAPSEAGQVNSRAYFEPLGFEPAENDTITGTDQADVLRGDAPPASDGGLPGALAFWSFADGAGGTFADARGGETAFAYRLYENQALLEIDTPTRAGPDGTEGAALEFNGEDSFGFIAHDPILEVTQGTVALWVQPDDLSDDAIILSKDQSGAGDGGHFRLGFEDGGRLFLRFAEGDGGSNHAWESFGSYLTEGQWTHLAVSFTEDGISVYADGVAIPDFAWIRKEGNLDSPNLATEAYLLQNAEPWVLGADTSRTKLNDTAAEFATDDERLDDAYDGAIAQFGIWGGYTPQDALTGAQVWQLYTEGPGAALTNPAGPQPMLAGDDVIHGEGGNDQIDGDAGNDMLYGGDGHDEINGGYGDDIVDGGDGNDVLDGGRGSDLLLGGAGNDTLISRSDVGEQRIGQLAIGEPTRGDPDNEVNQIRQKLYGWEDQPLIGDDILVGGEGNDTFIFNPLLNAKRDIIMEHVNDDRTIDWADVAGENNELHDHWGDAFGIDIVADFRAGEDNIVIVGHTVNPEVEHRLIDTDGDGIEDDAVSIITVFSNQGNGGGAHTQDLMGQIVVFGDLVDENAILVNAKVTHGIVDSIDELQEALAPSGDLKQTILEDGSVVYGYDTRDDQGNLGEVTSNPHLYSDNPFADSGLFEFASNVPEGVPVAAAVVDEISNPVVDDMNLPGQEANGSPRFINLPHQGAVTGMAQASGTIAFNFVAHNPGDGWQTLFSKDASNYVDGGHLTAWITNDSTVKVRYQSTNESRYLYAKEVEIGANEEHHFAFSFDGDQAVLYLDGEQMDVEDLTGNPTFQAGMSGNSESLVFGASAVSRRSGDLNNLKDYFDGEIDDVVVLDRVLYGAEAYQLAAGGLNYLDTTGQPVLGVLPDEGPPADDPPADDPPADDPPADDPPADDPPADDPPADDPPADDPPADDPPSDDPPADDPPADDPPADDPPADDPPADDPPADDPPADDPPADDPPADDPPADDPPADDPPADDPPADDPPADDPPADDPPADDPPADDPPADDPPDEDQEIEGTNRGDDLVGGAGDDLIDGGNGRDRLDGQDGDDVLLGGRGRDELSGGEGDDELDGGQGRDSLEGDDGDDLLLGGHGRDDLSGGEGDDVLEGGRGRDDLSGGEGDDELFGESGRDQLDGGEGDDYLDGGSGRDVLIGGEGDDEMVGGRGRDQFVFEWEAGDADLGLDVIRDFDSGRDKILFSDELVIQLSETEGGTRITFSNDAAEVVGMVDVEGDDLNPIRDLVRIPEDGDSLL